MKKLLFIVLTILPFLVFSQNCFFDNTTLKIEKTNINSSYSDFGPSIVNDELWYSSFTNEEMERLAKGQTKKIFYNLYSVPMNINSDILNGKYPQIDDISEGYHAGPVSYCVETGELFVTLSNFDNPDIRNKIYQKSDIRLKIVVVKKIEGKWKLMYEFPFNDSKYSVGHPTISKDGNILYFASNMPGTLGKTDIFMCTRNDSTWSEPVNLGNKINTSNDNMFPFLFEDNILIFSSRNENDKLNLFYTNLSDTSFVPKEIYELNSNEDDFGLVINNNKTVGYFTSRRNGGVGDDDIYKVLFTKIEPEPQPVLPVPVPLVVNQIFTLNNIFYDFDKWDILPESEVELDSLVTVLKEHPELKVELGSHTDCRGSDAYNIILSQKRSDSAVNYIVSKGISRDKIVAKGYGETILINKCDDGVWCSESEHRKNRRTEIKILEINK